MIPRDTASAHLSAAPRQELRSELFESNAVGSYISTEYAPRPDAVIRVYDYQNMSLARCSDFLRQQCERIK